MPIGPRALFRYLLPLQGLVLVLLAALPASAQETFTGLRAMGMAEAYVGGASGTSAIYHNPAGVGLAPFYMADLGFRHDVGPNLNSFGVAIADGATNPNFGGALAYNMTFGDGRFEGEGVEGRVDHNVRAALSLPIVPQKVSFGFGSRYLNYNRGTREALDANQDRYYGFSFDFGLLAAFIPQFAVGVSFLNLAAPEGAGLPRTLRLGTGLFLGPVHVEVDYGADFDSAEDTVSIFAVGTELIIDRTVPVRAGFRHEELTGRNVLAAGIGYRSEAGGLDAAFEINPEVSRDIAFALAFVGFF